MPEVEYAVRYGDHLVIDTTWHCVADVIGTYHGSSYTTPDGRVTGSLVTRNVGEVEWRGV